MAGRSHKLVTFAAAFACAAALTASVAPGALASGGGGGSSMGNSTSNTNNSSMANRGSSSNPAETYQRGVHALQEHQYRDAIRAFRTVLRAAPQDPTVNYVLGLAYIGDNDEAHARGPLEHAVAGPNGPLGAYLQLGLVYLHAGDHDHAVAQQTALQALLTACDAACGDTRRGQIQQNLDALTQAINTPAAQPAASPTTGWNFPTAPEGRAAYAEAVGLINTQHYSAAQEALGRAQAAIGPHPDILNYMGFTSRRLGRTDDALAFYQEALSLDPNHRGANEYLGELYLQMGRVDDARRQLARLDRLCAYGCAEREELAQWIELASN